LVVLIAVLVLKTGMSIISQHGCDYKADCSCTLTHAVMKHVLTAKSYSITSSLAII